MRITTYKAKADTYNTSELEMKNTYIKSTAEISLVSNNFNQLLSADKCIHAWQRSEYSHECNKLHRSNIQQHLHIYSILIHYNIPIWFPFKADK